MLTCVDVEGYLHQYDVLREVHVSPRSDLVYSPWLVRLWGRVSIYGEPHDFETELNLREFGGREDLAKLAEQLLKSFAGAAVHLGKVGARVPQ